MSGEDFGIPYRDQSEFQTKEADSRLDWAIFTLPAASACYRLLPSAPAIFRLLPFWIASGRRVGVATGPYVWMMMSGEDFWEPNRGRAKFRGKEAYYMAVRPFFFPRRLPPASASFRSVALLVVASASRLVRMSG